MRRVIFLFLDGVGLGADDPAINPLAGRVYPTLDRLTGGRPLTASSGRVIGASAALIPADAQMGIPGRPQSATGQATLLSGQNAPALLGEHYGPRPDSRVRRILGHGNLFQRVQELGLAACFINAYPQGYFDAVQRGKRLLSAIPYAATVAGLPLLTHEELRNGVALASDFTNEGWRTELGYTDVPVYSPAAAGAKLWELARDNALIFLEHWQTDVYGHHRQLTEAVADLQTFDGFLGGLLDAADLDDTLVIVASDHGNVEDCSHGKHTENPALTLLVGSASAEYAQKVWALTDLAPVALEYLAGKPG